MRNLFRRISETVKQYHWTVIALLLFAPPAVTTLSLALQAQPRVIEVGQLPDRESALRAREEAMDRSTHMEQLLVAIGSFELGILAYMGGVAFGKSKNLDSSQITVTQPTRTYFVLASMLLGITTMAYLHTWKVYLAYGTYAVQIELAYLNDPAQRITSYVFNHANTANLSTENLFLLAPSGVVGSFGLIALYPVVLLVVGIIAFGRCSRVSYDLLAAIIVSMLCALSIYLFPELIEFVHLVKLASG